jgi:hypothetical protein
MKPLATAIVLAVLTAASHAWPFVERNLGDTVFRQNLDQAIAFQSDNDRPLEIFPGGPGFLQVSANSSGGLSAVRVALPLPDTDPYPAGWTQVSFGEGRGTVGDIDGDGDIDIIYSASLLWENEEEPRNVRVVACRNDGNDVWTRLWQIKTTSGLTREAPAVRLADLDRDGDPEFIESSTGVRIRWNDGTGNHSTSTTLTTTLQSAPQIETGDFDGNGWIDVAVFGDVAGLHPEFPLWLTGRLTMFWNDGGTFTAQNIHDLTPGLMFHTSGLADLNADGRADLLTAHERFSGGSDLLWFRNTGSGFAAPVVLFSDPDVNKRGMRFHAADMDEDGRTDIVFGTVSGQIQWLRGTGGGSFASPIVLRTGGASGDASALCVADFDSDGDFDIHWAFGGDWLENRSIRMQSAASISPYSGVNPSGTVRLTTGDLNNDGRQDLVTADGGNTRIRWYPGSASGLQASSIISTGDLQPLGVATGDFNGDGWTDLAWTTTGILRQALSVNGSGFSWTVSTAATMSGIRDIIAEDMDRDGDTDILSNAPTANTIRIHYNNGSASTWLPQNVDAGISNLLGFTTGQFIPGGRPEVIALSTGFLQRYQFEGSSWNYAALANSNGIGASAGVAIADVSAQTPGPEVIYSLNTNGIFMRHPDTIPASLVSITPTITRLAVVDWNRDGHMDIIAATTSGVYLYTHQQTALASFGAPISLQSGTSFQDIVVMDLNGDAFPDAVASQATTGQLHLITNLTGGVQTTATGLPTAAVLPGAHAATASWVTSHKGMRIPEMRCAPGTLVTRFVRSNVVGGVDTPGMAMTQAEINALIDYVYLEVQGGNAYGAIAPSGVFEGFHFMSLSSSDRNGLAMTSRTGKTIQLKVKLKHTAGSSALKRFYVEFHPASCPWVTLDDNGNSSPVELRKYGTTEPQRTLIVVRDPSALENWRMTWFGQYEGTGIAANDYDDDGDGLPNLVEYVASRNPRVASGLSELSKPLVMVSGGPGTAVIAEVRILQTFDPKVRVRLQDSTGMQYWFNMATREGGSSWVGRTPTTTLLSGGRALYSFNTNVSPNDEPKYFLRLAAEEIP